jgi:transposase
MLPPGVRILVCTSVQDMRKSFDTLAAVARDFMGEDPEKGAVFVFLGKSPTRIKLLWFDRNGYCLLAKRLHRAFFLLPKFADAKSSSLRIDPDALAQLLAGVARENSRKRRLQ